MRPIKLELQGFTAFRENSEVDFSAFDLFAITGQTAAERLLYSTQSPIPCTGRPRV